MKRVLAIFLALLMLSTSVGFTFVTHYCGGKAVKTSLLLGRDEIGCGMTDMDLSCDDQSASSSIKSKGCCENKYTQISNVDGCNAPAVINALFDFQPIAVLAGAYRIPHSFNDSEKADYLNYSPPLPDLDIPVLIQSFLI